MICFLWVAKVTSMKYSGEIQSSRVNGRQIQRRSQWSPGGSGKNHEEPRVSNWIPLENKSVARSYARVKRVDERSGGIEGSLEKSKQTWRGHAERKQFCVKLTIFRTLSRHGTLYKIGLTEDTVYQVVTFMISILEISASSLGRNTM